MVEEYPVSPEEDNIPECLQWWRGRPCRDPDRPGRTPIPSDEELEEERADYREYREQVKRAERALRLLKPQDDSERGNLEYSLALIAEEYCDSWKFPVKAGFSETIQQLSRLEGQLKKVLRSIQRLGPGALEMLHRKRSSEDEGLWHRAGGQMLPDRFSYRNSHGLPPDGLDEPWDKRPRGVFYEERSIEASPWERLLFGLQNWCHTITSRMAPHGGKIGNKGLGEALERGTEKEWLAVACLVLLRKANRDPKGVLIKLMKLIHESKTGERADSRRSERSLRNQWGRMDQQRALQLCPARSDDIDWESPLLQVIGQVWARRLVIPRIRKRPSGEQQNV